jgi:hypothetical protein
VRQRLEDLWMRSWQDSMDYAWEWRGAWRQLWVLCHSTAGAQLSRRVQVYQCHHAMFEQHLMPNDRDLNYSTETAIRGKFLGHGAVVRSALGGNSAADLRCTIIPDCSSHH